MNIGMAGSDSVSTTQMVQDFFKKADANSDGGIDKSELKTMMANAPGGNQQTSDIDKIFAEVDANGDGKIDQSENAKQMEKIGKEVQARMGAGGSSGGGAPTGAAGGVPPGGGGGGGAAPASGSEESSSSSTVYDPKDANKDGVVSPQEELQYALKQITGSDEKQSSSNASGASDPTMKVVDALMKQIQNGTQYGQLGTTSVAAGGTPTLLNVKA